MKNPAVLIRQFTIQTRMRCAIVMVLGLLGLIALVVVWGGLRLTALTTEFTGHALHELRTVGVLRDQLAQASVLERDIIIHHSDLATSAAYFKRWQESLAGVRTQLDSMLQGPEDEDNVIARDVLTKLKAYEEQAQQVLNNPRRDEYENARSMDRLLAPTKQTLASMHDDLERIAKIVDAEAQGSRDELQQAMRTKIFALAIALVLAALVVTPLTLLNSSSITRPIQQAMDLAQAIAGGDLTRQIHAHGKDEVSTLLQALQRMQDSLRQLVGQVLDSSQNIRTASVEVASGNTDLSHRTEQAARALQQTSGSMEGLTGTVQSSALSAREASNLAASAASVAQRGGAVVGQVVATMEEINASSKKISDIIGTIDGIAFQTNILALNAAVEAARAGEQGRGFAVVAGEVRSLAQRSAGAAHEIKALIGASVERVDNGSRLVADAGRTMTEMVASVQRVVQIIDAMALAADDQSSGIGKINNAVSELDHMTQQNAALVEQSAAAADSLKQQATRLSEVVSAFRLQAV